MMGCDTNLGDSLADAEQASRAFTGSPLAGVRIVSDDGVFALSEAEPPKGFASQSPGTLAWWNDASSQQLFLYSRLVITPSDMGHALLNLERDLGIDSSFTNESAELTQAISKAKIEPPDSTIWQPATYALALEIMGFNPSEFVEVGKGQYVAVDCRLSKSIATTDASLKSFPSPMKAILLASQASCTSGCNCTTTDVCKTARCVSGVCVIKPKDCSIDSLCVISSYCDPDTGRCVHNWKDCDDGIFCTDDYCSRRTGECWHYPDPMSNQNCVNMLNLPEYLIPNMDDDNGNGIPDFDDPGPFPNDDELVWVPISTANCDISDCAGAISWTLWLEYNSYLKGYLNSDKTGPLGPGVVLPWPPPAGIYLESKACWCEMLRIAVIEDDAAPNSYCVSRMHQSVSSLCINAQLRWENGTASELLWGDENNGGIYIFPGKLSPDDQFSDQRREIDLVAQTEPEVSGLPVYFKVWDVDDPFDQLRGPNGVNEIPNVGVVDPNDINGVPTGNDNRGQTDPAVKTYVAYTDSNGEARITVTVSMQPGNNYRGTASIFSGAYNGPNPLVTQADADALSVTTNSAGKFVKNGFYSSSNSESVRWSRMLTVWRKVWIERDTMAAPDPTTLRATGVIDSVTANVPATGQATLVLSGTQQFNQDLNNYEESRVTITNCPFGADEFPVFESTTGVLKVVGIPGACAVGSGFTLFDDDNPTALGTTANPRFPECAAELAAAYADAYILPIYADEHKSVVPFEEYLSELEIVTGQGTWDNSKTLVASSNNFWTWFVVGAWEGSDDRFEADRDGDGDPDDCFTLFNPPLPRPGAETSTSGATTRTFRKSLIFFQAIADDEACLFQTDVCHVIIHEIGHAQIVGHNVPWGRMLIGAPKNQNDFWSGTLLKFREAEKW